MLKTCFKCNETKPIDDFYKHPRMADGHLGKCKECAKTDMKRRREEHPEHVRALEYESSRQPHRLENKARCHRRYNEAHPGRVAANKSVELAIQSGRLSREPCEECGARTTHGHHDDYTKPLEVRWLCARHHSRLHRRNDERAEAMAVR